MSRNYRRPAKDLLYEIQMVYLLRSYLARKVVDDALRARGDSGLPARNALIESWAINLRSVIAFIYLTRGSGTAEDHIADDYVDRLWRVQARSSP